MTSSSPVGSEGSDLSSVSTMMSAVMGVSKVAENGGSPPTIKCPSKPPGPNRIGRRNQETKEEKSSYNCPLCEKICTTQHQLTMHIRQHNTDTGGVDHSCSICGKSLSSASSLDRHMLVHSGERPYKCTVCGQSFTTNGNMHRHMKIHEKDPTSTTTAAPPSPLKRRRLSSKRKLSHDGESEKEDPTPTKKMVEDGSGDLEKASDEVFHCPVCFKEFVCKYGLETHMETHSDNPLRCDICCVTFRTPRGLLRHNALVHKQLPRDAMGRPFIQNNPSIPAGFHDLGFTDFSCRKFPRISQAWCETNLRRCISEQHRFVCDACDKAFPMQTSLALHKQTHAPADPGQDRPQAESLQGEDALDQKVFLAWLGLQHTKEARPAPAEEPLPSDNQAIQLQTLKCPLPQDPGCTAVLGLSALEAASLGSPITVLPATKDGLKHLSLQPFQKGFIIQPDSSIVVKPISGESAMELADIQQILKMAASAPPQISLPPLSKAPPNAPLQAIFKHMPPLKPKPLVTPRTLVATSTPPPLINTQQASPGCISPSLPPQPLKLLKGSVEAASHTHLLQSKSGAPLFLQAPQAELPGQAEMKAQLEQDSIIEALLPLSVEGKIKQEITEGDLKAIMTGPGGGGGGGKKAPAMRKVLYPCRFCNQVFAFSGVLRAHVRSHLGISPYQCNICDYIAADKAALIRHLRTHSGERPYICKICHYPFTVKANCERHLRKKHLKATRKDIEKNIEYVTSSAAELVDAFCAPDTVCRLCGQDLQHHRALRMHMRTHCARAPGTRARKPFECRECSAAFSARRNCVHHVLKQHLHVPEQDIDSYVLATDEAPGPASGATEEQKPLAAFLEPQNGFLHASPAPQLPHVAVKLEPASNFPGDFNEPLDFSQKGLALVHVKQENTGPFLSPGSTSPYDCSMEPIDLSIPKNARRGDREPATPAEDKTPEQEPNGTEPSPCPPPPGAALPVALGPSGAPEKPPVTTSAGTDLEGHTQPLQGTVQVALPIYSSALVNSSPLVGTPTLLSSPTLLRPLRPKPPLLLPKPPVSEELPPLASIAQIISSVSSAPTLLKTKVADPGPAGASSSGAASDSSGGSFPKAAAVPSSTASPKEPSDPPPAANSPEAASPPEPGSAGLSKKRSRKRGLRSRPRNGSDGVDLDSSGEFASIEKMLATTDTNKFSPFLQTAEDDSQEEAAPADHNGPSDEEQGSPPEERLLRAKRNSYANCLQKITCPHCPRVFPWASSLQRHLLTHTAAGTHPKSGQKPFPCQTCDAFFSTKSNCERHQLRKHGLTNCSLRRNGLIPQSKESDVGTHDSPDSQSDAETPTSGAHALDLTSREKEKEAAAPEPSPVVEEQRPIEEEGQGAAKPLPGEEAVASGSLGPEDRPGEERDEEEVDGPEEDTVSNQSLDLNLASTLMCFKLAEGEGVSGSQDHKHTCNICGKSFKFPGTLTRHHKAHGPEETKDEAQSAGGADEGSSVGPELEELPEEPPADGEASSEATAEKQSEETEGVSDGEVPAERKASEKSDDDRKPKTDSPRSAASKADKRKKVCTVCDKRFWSLQDLTRHMRSHTGERPYKCQTCERTFTLKHSLVRHQRVHQKARHAKAQGKDSDKDGEDSGSESTHSGNHPASEGETDLASVPRGHKESLALARDAGGREDRAVKRTAELGQAEAGRSPPRASDGPREQATQADPERDSPAGPTQDLSEPQAGRTAVAEDASPLLGME